MEAARWRWHGGRRLGGARDAGISPGEAVAPAFMMFAYDFMKRRWSLAATIVDALGHRAAQREARARDVQARPVLVCGSRAVLVGVALIALVLPSTARTRQRQSAGSTGSPRLPSIPASAQGGGRGTLRRAAQRRARPAQTHIASS